MLAEFEHVDLVGRGPEDRGAVDPLVDPDVALGPAPVVQRLVEPAGVNGPPAPTGHDLRAEVDVEGIESAEDFGEPGRERVREDDVGIPGDAVPVAGRQSGYRGLRDHTR